MTDIRYARREAKEPESKPVAEVATQELSTLPAMNEAMEGEGKLA